MEGIPDVIELELNVQTTDVGASVQGLISHLSLPDTEFSELVARYISSSESSSNSYVGPSVFSRVWPSMRNPELPYLLNRIRLVILSL